MKKKGSILTARMAKPQIKRLAMTDATGKPLLFWQGARGNDGFPPLVKRPLLRSNVAAPDWSEEVREGTSFT